MKSQTVTVRPLTGEFVGTTTRSVVIEQSRDRATLTIDVSPTGIIRLRIEDGKRQRVRLIDADALLLDAKEVPIVEDATGG